MTGATGLVAAAALGITLAAASGAAQSDRTVLDDSSRFRGAEWDVVPLVTLDSSRNADTLAMRQLGRVFVLGPGRLMFEGRLTRSGRWALFTVVDGTVRRFVDMGRDFALPNGVKYRIVPTDPAIAGAGGVTFLLHQGRALAYLTTDGESWHRTIGDTIRLGNSPVIVRGANVIHADDDSSFLVQVWFREPRELVAIIRLRNGGAEPILTSSDTLPGLGRVDPQYRTHGWTSVPVGMHHFVPTRQGWVASFRVGLGSGKYQEYLFKKAGSGQPRELLRTEVWDRTPDSLGTIHVLPGGQVITTRGEAIGVADAGGEWRQLLSAADVAAPRNQKFHLTDVTPLDTSSGAALLSVSFSSRESNAAPTMWSAWPKLYVYDGLKVAPVRVDSTRVMSNLFTSLRPEPVVRRVPGYQAGVILTQPFGLADPRSPVFYFATGFESAGFAPAFRTAQGDIGLDRLVGWNRETEAVVKWNGLALLRRR